MLNYDLIYVKRGESVIGTDSWKIVIQIFAVIILLLILIIRLTCPTLVLPKVRSRNCSRSIFYFLSNKRAKALRDNCTFHKTDIWINEVSFNKEVALNL